MAQLNIFGEEEKQSKKSTKSQYKKKQTSSDKPKLDISKLGIVNCDFGEYIQSITKKPKK